MSPLALGSCDEGLGLIVDKNYCYLQDREFSLSH